MFSSTVKKLQDRLTAHFQFLYQTLATCYPKQKMTEQQQSLARQPINTPERLGYPKHGNDGINLPIYLTRITRNLWKI
jgi:hypothetical protein